MRRSNVGLLLLVVLISTAGVAQITSPMEINDPGAQALQQRHLPELKLVAAALDGHTYPYAFYFSHVLDVTEPQQKLLPKSGIRFEKYDEKMVLAITGNYYASYSAELVDRSHRARQTFNEVILPLLKAAVPPLSGPQDFSAFAVEVSHHVRTKVLKVNTEAPENVVLVISRDAAERLVNATSPEQQQAAVLDAELYVDGQPMVLWLTGEEPQVQPKLSAAKMRERQRTAGVPVSATPVGFDVPASGTPLVSERLIGTSIMPARIITPETLRQLDLSQQNTIDRLVAQLNTQAHFVDYAPPGFIAFRSGAYLQLPITTDLPNAAGSQYKLAALAFDQHISHLLRPVMSFWPSGGDFDGVDYSTTIKSANGAKESVEFIFTMAALRCYARYDCTGQQLIDSGAVLINGERSTLDLQRAENQ